MLVAAILPPGFAAAGRSPVPLDGFADGVHHWRNAHDRYDYPRHAPEEIGAIAENLLLYQRANGGWPANEDPARILDPAERAALAAQRDTLDTSFDNRCTYTHVDYLAAVYAQTGDPRHRDACLRGLEFILAAQHASGGWPHSFPHDGSSYRAHLTIADDVMPGILATLRRCAAGRPPHDLVPPDLRERAAAAVTRGDRCLLALQIRQPGGRLAAWAGQYDAHTLRPAQGRAFELPSVVSSESVAVLRYLMSIESPPPEVITAVEGAAAWLERVAIQGWRLEEFPAEPVRYRYHTSSTDRRLVPDDTAPRLWARFYDLEDNSIVLANRDGRRVASLAEIDRERRTGYSWYGVWPEELLTHELPAWRARIRQ